MVFEFVDLPEPIRRETADVPEPLPRPVPDLPPAAAPVQKLAPKPAPAPARGTVREIHPSITPLAAESGMTRVTRPKFEPAPVGVAVRPKPEPPKRRTGWFFFVK